MSSLRIIARLDIKGPNLIKGIHLEGLKIVGDPQEFSREYYRQGIDEIVFMDTVASLYGRNQLDDIVERTAKNIFVPITVGGGIRSVEDTTNILRMGADRVAINTAAIDRPELIVEVSRRFGSQCMVLAIEANRNTNGEGWICYTDNGRERTKLDVVEWAKKGADLGAGEILLTSVNQEGTREGFDVDLIKAVSEAVTIPVIASGGMGTMDHFDAAVKEGGAGAIAIADALHYKRLSVADIRDEASRRGINVRKL